MTVMLNIFFRKLPSIIFVPSAIGGLIGLFLALFLFRKDRGKLYFFFTFSLIFMVGWRLAVRITASRYGLILLLPFSIATSFLCFQLKDLCRYIPFFPQPVLKRLPVLLLGLLVFISVSRCAVRDTHNSFLDIGRAVAEDTRDCKGKGLFSNPVGYSTHLDRVLQLIHYSSIPVTSHRDIQQWTSSPSQRRAIRQLIFWNAHRKFPPDRDSLYFFIQEKTKMPILTAEMLNLPEGTWHLVAQEYRNDEKKVVLRAYRYIPLKGTLGKALPPPKKKMTDGKKP